jgi:antitoxin HigA-1
MARAAPMIPTHRIPTHPGVILRDDFLTPLKLTQTEFAAHLGIPLQRLNELIRGKRGITPETAWLLSSALDTSPEFWMNLQALHDLAKVRSARVRVKSIVR